MVVRKSLAKVWKISEFRLLKESKKLRFDIQLMGLKPFKTNLIFSQVFDRFLVVLLDSISF